MKKKREIQQPKQLREGRKKQEEKPGRPHSLPAAARQLPDNITGRRGRYVPCWVVLFAQSLPGTMPDCVMKNR